jgi:hypothetical protein
VRCRRAGRWCSVTAPESKDDDEAEEDEEEETEEKSTKPATTLQKEIANAASAPAASKGLKLGSCPRR